MYGMKKTRVLRIEARRRPAAAIVSDRSRWDWYEGLVPRPNLQPVHASRVLG